MAASMAVSDVVGKVTFLRKFPMIIKATSDDDTPTAGYLYQEIADLTYVSSNYCKSLLDILVDRLDKPSHHIKFKVLRVMKYVIENGSEEFHSGLLRRSTGIQLATQFSGPPDPLHGNAPYIAVRSAAKELSEVLFDTERSRNKEPNQNKETARTRGLGTSQSGSSMEGFGNRGVSVHKEKSLGDTIKEGFRQLTDSFREPSLTVIHSQPQSDYRPLGGPESDRSAQTPFLFPSGRPKTSMGAEPLDGRGEYKPVVIDDGEGSRIRSCPPGNRDVRRLTSVHKQGRPAGGWEDSFGGRGSNTSNSDGQNSGDSTDLSERLASVSVEDVSMETKLVEDFVCATDDKPTPSRDVLAQFVKRCATLNCEKVTELLGVELQSTSALVQMRCLYALEALIREDIASAEHLSCFIPTSLKKVQAEATDRLLQAKASKILRQLERLQEEATATKFSKVQGNSTTHSNQDSILSVLQTGISNSPPTRGTERRQMPISNTEGLWATQKDNSSPLNVVESTSSVSKGSVQSSRSLFAGMDVGSALLKKEPEVQGVVQADKKSGHRWHKDGDNKSRCIQKGDAQLLDDLLDLSSTNQPTLVPEPGMSVTRVLRTNLNQSRELSDSVLYINSKTEDQMKKNNGKGAANTEDGRTSSTESKQDIQPKVATGTCSKLEGTNVTTMPNQPDSIMSRNANFQDLIAATGITVTSGNVNRITPVVESPNSQPSQPQPGHSQTAALNADQISTLYPQLAGVVLSGSSAVPLKLSRRPPEGNFAFVSSRDDGKDNSQRPSSFNFVKDAMLASKK
ncbi:AP-4 complex accessory subunit tepsin-like isoform X2 [Acanthaster planci]|uniref:AP-4 complex accessory subunit tepsin-like isoform X2 n=1 Tax=Acanthaster planci TaxID=133434 RepID=A0A8B7YGW0_ACAPL|nr:AP-4 complex accessory subunit tepsin-like isoform X2 [Acanthaster planci]